MLYFPRFRNHPMGILLASDVAARGLDIPDIRHVVHFQLPKTVEVNGEIFLLLMKLITSANPL
jgi:hypothetical protein